MAKHNRYPFKLVDKDNNEHELLLTEQEHERFIIHLELVEKIEYFISNLQGDLKGIKTPELVQMVENMIVKQQGIKKQGLDVIKRCRSDLRFLNSILKKIKDKKVQ